MKSFTEMNAFFVSTHAALLSESPPTRRTSLCPFLTRLVNHCMLFSYTSLFRSFLACLTGVRSLIAVSSIHVEIQTPLSSEQLGAVVALEVQLTVMDFFVDFQPLFRCERFIAQ